MPKSEWEGGLIETWDDTAMGTVFYAGRIDISVLVEVLS